jgi:DNA-directed RNA polymerase specialized sigma24 family protein
VLAVFREVARIASRSRRAFDADDIAGDVALAVVGRPEAVMARYPDPVIYARQRARHAGISFDRRERSQRGEGVRLHVGDDGQLQPGRRYLSADATMPDGGEGPLHIVIDRNPLPEVEVTERMVTGALLQRCSEGLSPEQFHEVWLVDGCGYTVQEVAVMRGQRRETLSRRLSEARTRMLQNAATH